MNEPINGFQSTAQRTVDADTNRNPGSTQITENGPAPTLQPGQQPVAQTTVPPTTAPQGQPTAATPILQHAPANPQSSLHARIFDGVLKTLSGGPIKVLQSDPTTGETRQVEVPQSGSKMANSILAGVLSSMFSGVESRQPGYNGPPPSTQPIMGAHGTMHAEEQAKQQALVDQMQDRKMKVLKANLETIQTQTAAARMGDEVMDKQIADGSQMLSMAKTYDQNLQNGEEPSIKKEHLNHQDAMAMIGDGKLGLIAVPEGRTSHLDPTTGKTVSDVTYTVMNPHIKVKLTEDDVAAMAQTNPSLADAYTRSGGNIELPFDVVNNARLVRGKIYNIQAGLDQIANDPEAAKALGVKGKLGNLMKIAGTDPRYRQVLQNTEAQMSAHANDRHYSILDAMLSTNGGPELAAKLGIDPAKANAWLDSEHNKRMSAEAVAKSGGIGDKALVDQDQAAKIVDAIDSNPNLSDSDKKTVKAMLPTPDDDGNYNMNKGQAAKVIAKAAQIESTNKGISERNALANGDSTVIQKFANNTIEGDINNISKAASMRGNARQNTINGLHDEAAKRGLDTTKFSEQAVEDKADMLKDFDANKKGSTGAQITSFNAFLGHTSGAVDAEKRLAGKTLGLTGKPVINSALRDIGKQLTNDADWKAYQTALVPVKNEIENFLAAGYAVKSEDSAVMHQILDDNETPERITAALKQLAETADIRLAAMGQKYLDRMDSTYSHLLSADSMNSLKNLKIDSKAARLSVNLPRGWQNGQAQQMTDKNMAAAYYNAAGRNKAAATELAKNNGWILN